MDQKIVRVNIGEVKVGRGEELLKATLGSCVGISFFDTVNNKCALAHCLLPESREGYGIGAKYVDQAISSLVALMKVKNRNQKEFIVSFAGGANMMGQIHADKNYEIGEKNLSALKEILKKYKFKVRELDSGLNYGRQMSIDCKTGEVDVSKLSS